MQSLLKELRSILVSFLDARSLCQLAMCNQSWVLTIQDEKLWKQRLLTDYNTSPVKDWTAIQSYTVFYAWPKRSEEFLKVFWAQMSMCPYDLPGVIKTEWDPIIKETGPINCDDIEIIWPQLDAGIYDLPKDLKPHIASALTIAHTGRQTLYPNYSPQ